MTRKSYNPKQSSTSRKVEKLKQSSTRGKVDKVEQSSKSRRVDKPKQSSTNQKVGKPKESSTIKNNYKIKRSLIWFFWDFLGTHAVWDKIKPHNKVAPTFFLWIVGIYGAIYGVAQQRYENRLDSLKNRANAITAQLTSSNASSVISLMPRIERTRIPYEPKIGRVFLTLKSLFGRGVESEQIAQLFKDIIELHKESLKGSNLSGINLSGMFLFGIDLSGVNLSMADLSNCNLSSANLSNADLRGANLSYATIVGTDLTNANLSYAK